MLFGAFGSQLSRDGTRRESARARARAAPDTHGRPSVRGAGNGMGGSGGTGASALAGDETSPVPRRRELSAEEGGPRAACVPVVVCETTQFPPLDSRILADVAARRPCGDSASARSESVNHPPFPHVPRRRGSEARACASTGHSPQVKKSC